MSENQKPNVALTPEQAFVCLRELIALTNKYAILCGKPDDAIAAVEDWIQRMFLSGKLPPRPVPTEGILVESLVASRDRKPYVRVTTMEGVHIAQLTSVTARAVANNIQAAAAAAEADAALFGFFTKMEFPDSSKGAMMQHFREFRSDLDEDGKNGD